MSRSFGSTESSSHKKEMPSLPAEGSYRTMIRVRNHSDRQRAPQKQPNKLLLAAYVNRASESYAEPHGTGHEVLPRSLHGTESLGRRPAIVKPLNSKMTKEIC
jgi:hypothetical protein